MPRCTPRLSAVLFAALLAGGAVAVLAVPAAAKSKPPVSLSGTVTNKGTGTVKNGTAAIEVDDFYFKKTFLKSAAGSVTVKLHNEGSATHTFTIDGQSVDVELAPGAKKTVTVQVDGTNPTAFYCRFHKGTGMQGSFYAVAGSS